MVVESMQQVFPCYAPQKMVREVGIEPTLPILEIGAFYLYATPALNHGSRPGIRTLSFQPI